MTDLQNLLEKSKEALRRDLNHIFSEVSAKKLSPSSARDLVAYVKLLSEEMKLLAKEAKDLAKSPTQDLEALARQLLLNDPTQPRTSPTRTEQTK